MKVTVQVKKIPYLNLEIQKIDIYFEEKGSGWAVFPHAKTSYFISVLMHLIFHFPTQLRVANMLREYYLHSPKMENQNQEIRKCSLFIFRYFLRSTHNFQNHLRKFLKCQFFFWKMQITSNKSSQLVIKKSIKVLNRFLIGKKR